jgi:hypothetical protein
MELIFIAASGLVGICIGAAGYRYMLKRDPERLETWAAEIKERARRMGK